MATYLCCLSALPPQPSPKRQLTHKDEIPKLASDVTSEISSLNGNLYHNADDLYKVVLDALQKLNDIEEVFGIDSFFWKYYTTGVAIGHFGADSNPDLGQQNIQGQALNLALTDETRLAGGRGAQKRFVADFDSELVCKWDIVLRPRLREEGLGLGFGGGDEMQRIRAATYVSPLHNHPNFFILEGCYRYLEAWIDLTSAPPRYETFAYDQCEDMEFHEELWDIINCLEGDEGRSHTDGRLGFMNYSPAGDIFVHHEWRNYYAKTRRAGSPNLAKAIARGLRGQDLMRAIMLDFNCWSTMRPDIWPKPSNASDVHPSSLTAFPQSDAPRSMHPFWTNIPSSVLILICSYLPLPTLQHLSATCWALHAALGEPGALDQALRRNRQRSLSQWQWLLPVTTLPGESESAYESARAWLPPGFDVGDPFTDDRFPWYAFTRACGHSLSMMNRYRLWGQVKQLEKVWRKYRREGGIGVRKGKTLEEIKEHLFRTRKGSKSHRKPTPI